MMFPIYYLLAFLLPLLQAQQTTLRESPTTMSLNSHHTATLHRRDASSNKICQSAACRQLCSGKTGESLQQCAEAGRQLWLKTKQDADKFCRGKPKCMSAMVDCVTVQGRTFSTCTKLYTNYPNLSEFNRICSGKNCRRKCKGLVGNDLRKCVAEGRRIWKEAKRHAAEFCQTSKHCRGAIVDCITSQDQSLATCRSRYEQKYPGFRGKQGHAGHASPSKPPSTLSEFHRLCNDKNCQRRCNGKSGEDLRKCADEGRRIWKEAKRQAGEFCQTNEHCRSAIVDCITSQDQSLDTCRSLYEKKFPGFRGQRKGQQHQSQNGQQKQPDQGQQQNGQQKQPDQGPQQNVQQKQPDQGQQQNGQQKQPDQGQQQNGQQKQPDQGQQQNGQQKQPDQGQQQNGQQEQPDKGQQQHGQQGQQQAQHNQGHQNQTAPTNPNDITKVTQQFCGSNNFPCTTVLKDCLTNERKSLDECKRIYEHAPKPVVGSLLPPENTRMLELDGRTSNLEHKTNGRQFKEAVNEGMRRVFGDDQGAMSLAQGAFSFESSFGTFWPTEKNQRDIGKHRTMMEEIGPMRMNRQMLEDMGYTEEQMQRMNQINTESIKYATEVFAKALKGYGIQGFFHYHRGGLGRYRKYVQGQLEDKDRQDTFEFRDAYQRLQRSFLSKGIFKDQSNQVIWYDSKVKPI